ncbi:trace amine-associated receptor 1-like [Symphorus nematophorus]
MLATCANHGFSHVNRDGIVWSEPLLKMPEKLWPSLRALHVLGLENRADNLMSRDRPLADQWRLHPKADLDAQDERAEPGGKRVKGEWITLAHSRQAGGVVEEAEGQKPGKYTVQAIKLGPGKMAAEVTDLYPCYETGNDSYILTSSPSTVCVLLYIFLGSLSAVTICGNLLVIISIIYFKQLHTPTNFLILSLAMADLLVGVVVFPLSMEFSLSSCLYYQNLFCKIRDSFDITLSTASILNLCCISIDRYYAVCQPLTYRMKINVCVVVIMILVIWTVSVLAGLNHEKCEENCFIDVLLAKLLGSIFSFYLPVLVMLCIYLKIFLVAQRQARSIQDTKCGATVSKMERKATKTLATVMGVFLMCWSPFFLCFSFQLLNHVSVPVPVSETLNWLLLSNSMLNPFIYAFFYSWFRSAFRMIISGKIFQGDFMNSKLH